MTDIDAAHIQYAVGATVHPDAAVRRERDQIAVRPDTRIAGDVSGVKSRPVDVAKEAASTRRKRIDANELADDRFRAKSNTFPTCDSKCEQCYSRNGVGSNVETTRRQFGDRDSRLVIGRNLYCAMGHAKPFRIKHDMLYVGLFPRIRDMNHAVW